MVYAHNSGKLKNVQTRELVTVLERVWSWEWRLKILFQHIEKNVHSEDCREVSQGSTLLGECGGKFGKRLTKKFLRSKNIGNI